MQECTNRWFLYWILWNCTFGSYVRTYAYTHSTIKYNQLAVTVRISLSLSASFSLAVSQQYDFQYGVYAQMEQGVVKRYIEINEKTQ